MNFAEKLERLRSAVSFGISPHRNITVMLDDLKALIYHFDRLDNEIRDKHKEEAKTCEWTYYDHPFYEPDWRGSCGVAWVIIDGTPEENHMNFCPQCGGKILHVKDK